MTTYCRYKDRATTASARAKCKLYDLDAVSPKASHRLSLVKTQ